MTSTILLHLLVFVLIIANIICCREKRRPPLSGSCHKFHPCSPPLQTKNKPLLIIFWSILFILLLFCRQDLLEQFHSHATYPLKNIHWIGTSWQARFLHKTASSWWEVWVSHSADWGHSLLIIGSHLNSSASSLAWLPLVCNELLPGYYQDLPWPWWREK